MIGDDSIVLTKDLILCRNERGGRLRPLFLRVDDERFLTQAAEILTAFDVEKNPTREEIEELTSTMTAEWPNLRQARGILKIATDLAEFSQPADLDYASARLVLCKLLQSCCGLNQHERQ